MSTIFDRVSRNNEDATTELLVSLMQVSYIREYILQFFEIDSATVGASIKPDHIHSQVNVPDVGRPDIIIENKTCTIYIENKIRLETPLQDSQVTTYLERLKNTSKSFKRMIYLIPDSYNLDLGKELPDRVAEKELCKVFRWSDLLTFLYSKQVFKWNEIVSESLAYLSDLILGKEVSIQLSREELVLMFSTQDFITANSLIIKAKSFIDQVDQKLIPLLGRDFDYSSWSWLDNELEMGKYIRYKNKQLVFFGFNLGLLKQFPDKQDFFLGVDIAKDIIDEHKLPPDGSYYFDGSWYYFKLDKYVYSDFENVDNAVQEIAKIIKNYI